MAAVMRAILKEKSGRAMAEHFSTEVRRTWEHHLVDYDPARRRVWIGGQRLHHGATGAAFAAAGLAGLAGRRLPLHDCVPVALLGTVLMAHDWKDRGCWFRRGPQFD
jgi:hypothetical protein